jgi:hypothetical protein
VYTNNPRLLGSADDKSVSCDEPRPIPTSPSTPSAWLVTGAHCLSTSPHPTTSRLIPGPSRVVPLSENHVCLLICKKKQNKTEGEKGVWCLKGMNNDSPCQLLEGPRGIDKRWCLGELVCCFRSKRLFTRPFSQLLVAVTPLLPRLYPCTAFRIPKSFLLIRPPKTQTSISMRSVAVRQSTGHSSHFGLRYS